MLATLSGRRSGSCCFAGLVILKMKKCLIWENEPVSSDLICME